MTRSDLSRNPALWLGLRQVEAIRDSLRLTLYGIPLPNQRSEQPLKDELTAWLATQGLSEYDELNYAMMDRFMQACRIPLEGLATASNAPAGWMNLGAKRSGAGWQNPANFIITSAFVRLLGALEQFEMDVLKCLFYYRPSGMLGDEEDWLEQEVEPDVVQEVPQIDKKDPTKQIYSKPPLWTWLKKQAENNIERSRIFMNVFGISTIAGNYKGRQKQVWYEKRNAIAHGRAGVDMTLGEYSDVEIFVAKSMFHVSNQCREKLKLVV